MRKLSALLFVLFLFGCSKDKSNPVTNPTPAAYEPNGAWNYSGASLTYNPGTCGFLSNPLASVNGTFIVARVGDNISATSNGVTYTGTFLNNVIDITSTYVNGLSFLEADVVSFGLTSNNAGQGSFSWSMSNGAQACSGTNALTATKL